MAGKTQGWKLYKDPESGVYRVRFRMDGKRYHRSTGKTDRAAAQSAAARIVRRVTEGDISDRGVPDLPLPELIGSWLAGVKSEVSPDTLRTWELYAGAHFIPHFKTADRLCSERCLRDYMRKRLEVVKARSVQKELSGIRRLLAWMVERGLVEKAPVVPRLPRRATGTAHPSGWRKRIDLTPEEMDAIVRALPLRTRDGQPLRAYFEVMRETGLRPGTLQRLRAPDDYRPGSKSLRIRAEADKARYARDVPLSARACEVLDEVCPAEGIIFPKFAWRYPLRTAALAAGLESDRASQVKPYDFRHSVATELTERSGNLPGVGYLLGHRHATTTNQYVHARRRAAESVLSGQNESSFENHWNTAGSKSPQSLQCEGQDSNLHARRTLEPKSSASANSATLAFGGSSDG